VFSHVLHSRSSAVMRSAGVGLSRLCITSLAAVDTTASDVAGVALGGAGALTFLGVCAPAVVDLKGEGADLGIAILSAPPLSALGLPSVPSTSLVVAGGDLGWAAGEAVLAGAVAAFVGVRQVLSALNRVDSSGHPVSAGNGSAPLCSEILRYTDSIHTFRSTVCACFEGVGATSPPPGVLQARGSEPVLAYTTKGVLMIKRIQEG
jgi:hypothetical protein